MKPITKILFLAGIIILTFIFVEIAKSPTSNDINIYFLNVGQGDAELIQKGDYQILIDGGPDGSVLAELGKIMPLTDRRIDVVILTHPHSDHLTGLNEVMKRYEVGQIYTSGSVTTSNQYLNFLNTVKEKNIPLLIPGVGEERTLFDNAKLQFLWPGDKYKGISGENLNNTSEVIRFCFESHCAIFLGDLETDEQKLMFAELDKQKIDYTANLLKVAHHGSTNGTDQTTLGSIKPSFSAIEVGADNQFGHPHAATLDLLKANNVQIFRTDRDGTIRFMMTKEGIFKQ